MMFRFPPNPDMSWGAIAGLVIFFVTLVVLSGGVQ
jgi:hypothetical protein